MPMSRKEKIEYVRKTLDDFAKLERKVGDEVSWIALKMSCTPRQAEQLIEAARRKRPPAEDQGTAT